MQDKALKVAKAAEAAAAHLNDWQQIKLFISNRITEIELTPGQHEKLKRYNAIYSEMLSNKYDEVELPVMISKTFGISESQAYRDINDVKEIYSKVVKIDKLFEIKQSIEMCKRVLRKCEELNDMKAFAMIDKNLQKYKAMLPDDDVTVTEGWQPPEISAMFNPVLIGMPMELDMKKFLERLNEKRNAKINLDMIEEALIVEENNDSTSENNP